MLNLKAQRPAEGIGSAEGVLLSEEPLSLDLGRRAAHLAILPSGVALADSEPSEDGEPSATRDELRGSSKRAVRGSVFTALPALRSRASRATAK